MFINESLPGLKYQTVFWNAHSSVKSNNFVEFRRGLKSIYVNWPWALVTCLQEIHCSLLKIMEMEIQKKLYMTEKEKWVSTWKPACHSRSSLGPFVKSWEFLRSREKNGSNAFTFNSQNCLHPFKAPDVVSQGVFTLESFPANLNHIVALTIEINFKYYSEKSSKLIF